MSWERIIFTITVIWSTSLFALNPKNNLVPDYDLKAFDKTWEATKGSIPGVVNQFEGLPEFFHYRTYKRPFLMKSGKLTLKPDTEYEAMLIFKNPGRIPPRKHGIRFSVDNGTEPFKTVVAYNVKSGAV